MEAKELDHVSSSTLAILLLKGGHNSHTLIKQSFNLNKDLNLTCISVFTSTTLIVEEGNFTKMLKQTIFLT